MEEKSIVIKNIKVWESKDLPIGTYFKVDKNDSTGISEDSIILKMYGEGYIDITNGSKSWSSSTNFKNCQILTRIEIKTFS